MDIALPISSFVIPSSFSTLNSTGRPWVSHPSFLSTRKPLRVFYLQNISFIVRDITWWIPGIPFADGGPSKKTNLCLEDLVSMLFLKELSITQKSDIVLEILLRLSSLYSGNFFKRIIG